MRTLSILVAGLVSLSAFAYAQTKVNLNDVLKDRYGSTADWVIRDGVIVSWKPTKVGAVIPQPTATNLDIWRTDSALIEKAKTDTIDPSWRALVAALCVMTECTNEDAAWAAFLAAIP